MLTRLTHGLNALIFGSLAYMASSFSPVANIAEQRQAQPTVTSRTVTTLPVNPVRTVSDQSTEVRPSSERSSPVRTVTETPVAVAPLAKSTAKAAPSVNGTSPVGPSPREGSAPRLFSPSSPLMPLAATNGTAAQQQGRPALARGVDPIIAPVPRKRPSEIVATADDRKTKSNSSRTKSDASSQARPATAAGPKANIDLSGRSALGAPPAQVTKCTTGQKYDARAQKCLKLPGAAAKAAPVRANTAPAVTR